MILEARTIFTFYGDDTQIDIFSYILFRRGEWNTELKNFHTHTQHFNDS